MSLPQRKDGHLHKIAPKKLAEYHSTVLEAAREQVAYRNKKA